MSIGIYKIENLINHKCYIGQSINIENRWKQHMAPNGYANPFSKVYNYPLYKDFRKYGIENFSFKIVELCEENLLDEKEKIWIKRYNSYFNGYNQTLGGSGNKKELSKIYQYDMFGNYLKEFTNIYEASKETGITTVNIYCCLSKKRAQKTAGGFQWSYNKVDKIENAFSSCPVIAFTFSGERKKFYSSINEAMNETGDEYYSIKKSCDTKQHSGAHYQWRYWFENPNLQKISPYKWSLNKAVDQYDLEGNYIATFESLSDAANKLKMDSSNLSACCQKKQKSFGGYQWCYHNEEPPSSYIDNRIGHKTSSNKRIIQQFTKNNEFLNEYESAHEAARQIGFPQSANHITECCQGKRKTCRQYIWKYKEEEYYVF